MKIQAVAGSFNPAKGSIQQKKNLIGFNGYVNGHYYKDEIIALAKEYRYKKNWKDVLRSRKESIGEAVSNWHYEYANADDTCPPASRVLMGIFTLGMSEVLMDTTTAISAAVRNSGIEKQINEIAKCIDDLKYE